MFVDVHLTRLTVYPVKSCRGIDLQEASLTPHGIEMDREWMVVDEQGEFLTQRNHPRMALIHTTLEPDALILMAPGMGPLWVTLSTDNPAATVPVRVWEHATLARDAGRAAAEWLSRYLGVNVRLVRWGSDQHRYSSRDWTGGIESEARFADAFPYLVLSEASLAGLNARIGAGATLPMDRFRPNLVIAGCDAHDEDRLTELTSATAAFRAVKPCTRCRITNTDQETASVGIQPLETLAAYRRDSRFKAPVFGQNLILLRGAGARIRVGDAFQLSALPPTAATPHL
jgi:uncharacterized protein YcbX